MSLTLARLCGEWQLVSKNYEARSGKYEARISDLSYSCSRLFLSQNIAILAEIQSSDINLLYTCRHRKIFPDFSESGKPLRKIGKPLKKISWKSESR
jgi:hypothetical protein